MPLPFLTNLRSQGITMLLSELPQCPAKWKIILCLFVMTVHLYNFFFFFPCSSEHIFAKLCIYFLALELFPKLLTGKYHCHAILPYLDPKCRKSSVSSASSFMEIQENQFLQTDWGRSRWRSEPMQNKFGVLITDLSNNQESKLSQLLQCM